MKRLFQALSNTKDGAFVINEQNQIIFWNQAAQALMNYTADEVVGRYCYEVIKGRDEQGRFVCQHYCQVTNGALQGVPLPNLDMYASKRNGEGCWINLTTFVFPTGEQESGNVIVHLFRDVSRTKSNERFVEKILAATRGLQNGNGQPTFSTMPDEFPSAPGFEDLTPRERQVLRLLADGLGTEEMAESLNISPATTRNHIQSILEKLRVHSRLEAVTYAYQQGLIDIGEA